MPETLPLLEVLRGTERYLADRGVENPRLNAEHLLAHALGLKRMELYLQFDRPLTEAERAPLRDLVKRRGAREPLQPVLGTAEFHGRTFACDKRGLVPRPETEQLVEIALEITKTTTSPRILDIGTGSGVIAPTRHELAARISFPHADLLPIGDIKFDLIAAHLPYIPAGEIAALSPEVRHDPLAALDGGPDGLDLIRRLAAIAPDRLTPGGALLLEIGAGQADAVNALLAEERKFRDISIRPDYQNIPRFAVGFHG